MESNTFEKSTKNNVASAFFARTPKIRSIVRICEAKDRFQQNSSDFFQEFCQFQIDTVVTYSKYEYVKYTYM